MSTTITYPFTTPSNYTYDNTIVEIAGGVAKLKDITPANSTCGANYVCGTLDLTYGDGVITGTGVGSPTVSNSLVDLTGALDQYVDYDADLNADGQQVGTIRFDLVPNWTGSPADDQYLFSICKENNSTLNLISLYVNTSGFILLRVNDSTGASIINAAIAAWSPTAGNTYTFELDYDFTAGATRVFLDGVEQGATQTGTGTRDANIGLLRMGGYYDGTVGQSNLKYSNLVVFSTVQHTIDHAGDLPFDMPTKYSLANPTVSMNSTFSSSLLTAFSSTDTVVLNDLVKFTISHAGQEKYVTGGAVVNSDGTYAQSSIESDISTYIEDFASTKGTVAVKLFLHSECGRTSPSVDIISITYNSNIATPSLTLCALEGYIYNANGVVANQIVEIRPFAGFINSTVLHKYTWTTIATTGSDGWFEGRIYVQATGEYWEMRVGTQRYKIQLPNADEADFSTLLSFEVIET